MRSNAEQMAAMLGIPVPFFRDALKQYRKDVPTVGTVTQETVEQFLHEGRICRGWLQSDGGKRYFHIIRSPEDFPQKALFSGESESELFAMAVALGMEHGVELEDLVSP